MKTIALQVYGLPKDKNAIKKVLKDSGISRIEVNIADVRDVEWYREFLENEENITASGVHFNLSLLEGVEHKGVKFIKEYGAKTLIIPAALEENSLAWPLIYLRRFPKFYQLVRELVDRFQFKGMRRKIAGTKTNQLSYFLENFWLSLCDELKKFKNTGVALGYHNHGIEFEKFGMEKTIYELLDQKLDQEIFFQMDITNLLMSGHYSVELIQKYIHRIKSFHLRIEGPGTEGFYQELFKNHPTIFENKEMVIELKENSADEMIKRNLWWKNLINSVS